MGKVIITGPGRAGTSFLVRLLTRLGEDTGFTRERDGYSEELRAGCEQKAIVDLIDGEATRETVARMPRVVKSPDWSFVLKNLVKQGWLDVDHVLIPFRDLDLSAQSRLDVGLDWLLEGVYTEHWMKALAQANIHALALGRTLEACWVCGLPHTVMTFPLLVQDAGYCFDRLSRAFALERTQFNMEFEQLARPEQVRWN